MEQTNIIYPEFVEKRRRIIEEGSAAIERLRTYLKCWNNSDEISELLDSIEASKTILYSMYDNKVDNIIVEIVSSYNKILNELLSQAIIEGVN